MGSRRGRHRRARLALTLAALLFCGVQAGFLTVVEGWWPTLADAEFGVRLENLRTLRRRHPTRRSIVVLGSSRIGNGFDTDYASARSFDADRPDSPVVVNMSMTGGTGVWQYLALRRLIDRGLKPDAVIIEVLPMTLASDEQYFDPGYRFPTHRLRWGDIGALAALMPAQARAHAWAWAWDNALFPLHTHRFTLVGLFAAKWQVDQQAEQQPAVWRRIISPTGWIPFGVDRPTPEQRRKAEEVAQNAYGRIGRSETIGGNVTATYRALFACCREHGIEIAAVVMMPESEMFRSLYGPALRAEVGRFAATLRQEGIEVVDAREWIPAEQFWDGHHLLEEGARSFTARICTETLGFSRPAGGERIATVSAPTTD